MKISMKGQLIAAAVASLFASGCATTAPAAMEKDSKMGAAMVHCGGVNTCKGQSGCATQTTSCKGQNECKGKGWVPTASEKECTDQGGTVMASKM